MGSGGRSQSQGGRARHRRAEEDLRQLTRHARVPFDHRDPKLGTFPLEYELGAPFDAKKPTVIYIIDAVRRAVVGADGKVMIYGRSGGGLLAHQYLAKYADHVTRAFTQAAVNPYLEAELHTNPDRLRAGDRGVRPGAERRSWRSCSRAIHSSGWSSRRYFSGRTECADRIAARHRHPRSSLRVLRAGCRGSIAMPVRRFDGRVVARHRVAAPL